MWPRNQYVWVKKKPQLSPEDAVSQMETHVLQKNRDAQEGYKQVQDEVKGATVLEVSDKFVKIVQVDELDRSINEELEAQGIDAKMFPKEYQKLKSFLETMRTASVQTRTSEVLSFQNKQDGKNVIELVFLFSMKLTDGHVFAAFSKYHREWTGGETGGETVRNQNFESHVRDFLTYKATAALAKEVQQPFVLQQIQKILQDEDPESQAVIAAGHDRESPGDPKSSDERRGWWRRLDQDVKVLEFHLSSGP